MPFGLVYTHANASLFSGGWWEPGEEHEYAMHSRPILGTTALPHSKLLQDITTGRSVSERETHRDGRGKSDAYRALSMV